MKQKKRFRVYFSYEAQAYADVEAENEDEAKNMIIFGEYENPNIYDGSSNEIDEVIELKEKKNGNIRRAVK